jgi:hypothetical protein
MRIAQFSRPPKRKRLSKIKDLGESATSPFRVDWGSSQCDSQLEPPGGSDPNHCVRAGLPVPA